MGTPTGDRMSVVTALVRGSFLVDAVYAASSREHGLTPQQGGLLCVLMSQPYRMSELGTVLGLMKSSLTGLVDRTERRGWVRRETDPADARAVRVALTADGRKLADTFYAETCRRVDELAAGLSPAHRDSLARLLGRIVEDNKVPAVFIDPADQAMITDA